VYCDGVQVGLSPFTAIFMLTMQPAGQTVNTPPVRVANIRMSLEHAKVMAILLRKQLKAFEAGAGVTIQIPPQVYQQLGISKLEDW
jgi:hypothetical protein